ncbi:MAG: hypothetical protein E7157_01340 [Lactobacillales bacterium]|nr:hypothetical protein [Lactobacillales bacterium]
MKLNKKGFVSTAVLYSLLLLFLALILGLLALLSNRKQILDKLKGDIKSEINQTKNFTYYKNGTAIYYNPVTGKICGNYSEENSKTGVTEGCLKWYVFNDNKNSATVNMILDHNTSGNVAWASLEDYIEVGGTEEEYGENGKNIKGPLTVTKRLNEDTENWKNKARLISADEIAKITGAAEILKWSSNKTYGTNIETESSWFYLDGVGTTYTEWQKQVANETTKSKYAWLFDNNGGCKNYGCNFEDNVKYPYDTKDSENTSAIWGYWTSTPLNGISKEYAWYISTNGNLGNKPVSMNDTRGVRPVITVSKKDIYTQYKETLLNGTDPVYSDNLIPVTIADNGTVTKADTSVEWYKYENKKWANAVILNDESKTFNNGEVIPESDIESYFVWIPRYKYQIFDLGTYETYSGTIQPDENNAKEIQIVFENKGTAISNGNAVGEYLSHPAFQAFDTNGLWVGKFETTGSIDSLTIKPSVASIRSQNVSTMFTKALAYKQENKSHMMKNTEWGAVAYLSHSKYGINKEININNNSSYLTGYSAVDGTDQSKYPGTYGTDSSVTLVYNTDTGYKASTTGNITGVYDMSGGAHEYMASYMDGQLGSSGFTSDPITEYGKEYFDKYSNTSTWTSFNNRILGDATGEMGPFYQYADGDGTTRNHNDWYADISGFVDSSRPWFIRGGDFSNGVLTSQFYFSRASGSYGNGVGFRLVLTK